MCYVEPMGLSILYFGGSVSMSSSAAPAGIMGKTLSDLIHSAWMRTGPSLYSSACLTILETSAGRLM